MIVKDPLRLKFQGENGEKITFHVKEHVTVYGVTYSFDDESDQAHVLPKGEDLVFTLSTASNPKILRLFFFFQTPGGTGGSYDVKVSGSKGGALEEDPVKQAGNNNILIRKHTFRVQ